MKPGKNQAGRAIARTCWSPDRHRNSRDSFTPTFSRACIQPKSSTDMATPDAVAMLRSIDATLKQILQLLQQAIPKPVADESELNNPKADEEIKVEPRDWVGKLYKGRHLSEAPPAFLELLARTYEWCRETLVGIAETIRRTNTVTLRQREAIEHIMVGRLKHDAHHHE